jgi:hypothetical protein
VADAKSLARIPARNSYERAISKTGRTPQRSSHEGPFVAAASALPPHMVARGGASSGSSANCSPDSVLSADFRLSPILGERTPRGSTDVDESSPQLFGRVGSSQRLVPRRRRGSSQEYLLRDSSSPSSAPAAVSVAAAISSGSQPSRRPPTYDGRYKSGVPVPAGAGGRQSPTSPQRRTSTSPQGRSTQVDFLDFDAGRSRSRSSGSAATGASSATGTGTGTWPVPSPTRQDSLFFALTVGREGSTTNLHSAARPSRSSSFNSPRTSSHNIPVPPWQAQSSVAQGLGHPAEQEPSRSPRSSGVDMQSHMRAGTPRRSSSMGPQAARHTAPPVSTRHREDSSGSITSQASGSSPRRYMTLAQSSEEQDDWSSHGPETVI